MEASRVTNSLIKQLSFRAQKQKVISSNIANIDTPNYKTKDLTFQKAMENSKNQLKLTSTNKMHIIPNSNIKDKVIQYEVKGLQEQNDGNNVNLEQQMSEQSKNNLLFRAITSSLKKDSRFLKMSIDSASKTN